MGLKSKSYMSQWSASTLAESEMNQVEENPRRREEPLEETRNNNKNGYSDMKQRTKLDMLCSVIWGSETTSQKVRLRLYLSSVVMFYISSRGKSIKPTCFRERERDHKRKQSPKPKAQKDILKIHGKEKNPRKGEHGKEPITKPSSKNY